MRRHSYVLMFLGAVFSACSDDKSNTGGSAGTGAGAGTPGATGGASSGGSSAGGTPATGGAATSGGSAGATAKGGAGGTSAAGQGGGSGSAGAAGAAGAGAAGAGAAGGMSGGGAAGSAGTAGMAGSAGAAPTGGAAGNAGAAGSGGGSTTMSFFVTSKGGDKGGAFGGLEGADAFCKSLATAVSAELGQKQWRAYLSTSTVNARDRIGTGPWRNQARQVIANDLTQLHDQIADAATLNSTWPVASTMIALDEKGMQVVNDVHDVLTGSDTDGKAMMNMTCNDWTSQETAATAQVGHSNRTGGGRPPSWNSTHSVGCAPSAQNRQQNTVTSGGGRGSIYCFALP